MDNNKISKIPVSELTPENINSLKKESGPIKPARKEKNTNEEAAKHHLILAIVGAILLIGVAAVLFFIFRQPSTDKPTEQPEEEPAEIVWAPSEDSKDPSREYIEAHEATINSADATDDEKLDAQLQIVNLYAVTGLYDEGEAMLNAIDRDSLSYRQLFNLYSAYAYLYEHSGNETAYKEYSELINNVLDIYWDEETPGEGSNSDSSEKSSETTGE